MISVTCPGRVHASRESPHRYVNAEPRMRSGVRDPPTQRPITGRRLKRSLVGPPTGKVTQLMRRLARISLGSAVLVLLLGVLAHGTLSTNASSPPTTTTTLASGTSSVTANGNLAVIVPRNARYGLIPHTRWIDSTTHHPLGSPDTFTVTFTLPSGFYGAQLSGLVFADNWAVVSLNGVQIAAQPAGDIPSNYGYSGVPSGPNSGPPTPFSASTGFVPGLNTLTFQVTDVGPPEGLDFSATVTYQTVPTAKDQCKDGGWQNLVDSSGNAFKNQGDCVSFVATGGKNLGAG